MDAQYVAIYVDGEDDNPKRSFCDLPHRYSGVVVATVFTTAISIVGAAAIAH